MPSAPQRWFVTPNGNLSVARLHIALGACYLMYPLINPFWSAFVRRGADAVAMSEGQTVWTLLIGMIVLIVGGIALVLEARVERTPSPALWPAPPEKKDAPAHSYRFDIAVMQLALGVLLIPFVSLSIPAAVPGWRIVAITAASELVYLAFLGARLVQQEELAEVLRAIKKVQLQAASVKEDPSKTAEQRLAPEARLAALKARADVLMEQLS